MDWIALAASGALAVSVVLLPWFELGAYEASGWDSGWLLKATLLTAVVNAVALRVDADPRATAVTAAIALIGVAVAVIWPPDFGFGFDGLDVPVERELGCWIGLALALIAAAAAGARLSGSGRAPASRPESAGPPRPAGAR